jgi:hypothetical protein
MRSAVPGCGMTWITVLLNVVLLTCDGVTGGEAHLECDEIPNGQTLRNRVANLDRVRAGSVCSRQERIRNRLDSDLTGVAEVVRRALLDVPRVDVHE